MQSQIPYKWEIFAGANFRYLAPEPSAEFFVGSNIRGSMPENHTY